MVSKIFSKGKYYFIIFSVIHFIIVMIFTISMELEMTDYTWDIVPTGGYVCYTKGILIVLLGIGGSFILLTEVKSIIKFIIASVLWNFLICPIVVMPIEKAANEFQINRLENKRIEEEVKVENQFRKLRSNDVELKSYVDFDHIIFESNESQIKYEIHLTNTGQLTAEKIGE